MYSEYTLYRSSGIYVNGLEDCRYTQTDFWSNNEKFLKLSKITDKIEIKKILDTYINSYFDENEIFINKVGEVNE